MNWKAILDQIDAGTARSFVSATRNVIDAMLIEAARVEQTSAPQVRDYDSAELSRETPGGGWISHEELRATTQRMAEAIAAEKWTDGMMTAMRLLTSLGV